MQGPELSAEARGLLDPAWQLRWRAPEMALLFSDRALARARATGERALRLRAEGVALFALNRTGRGVAAADRALAALRDAEEAGEHGVAADLRVELACAARQVGGHEVAVRVLGPVLRRRDLPVAGRIHALVEFACSSAVGDERAEVLDEAERLCGASGLERDTARVLRAQVSAASAGHSRREGQFDTAAEVAQSGLALLRQLGDPGADSGQFRASLALERVHALLELGRRAEAVRTAETVLHEPVRAAAASPVGWLRYVLATRVHLLDGSTGAAIGLLGEAARSAEWFHLDDLLVEALSTLSHVHEENEDVERALHCLRRAHAADRRWRAAVHAARLRLNAEFPASSEGSTAPAEPEPRRRHAPAPESDVPVARAAASAGGGAAGSPAPEGPAAGGPDPVGAAPSTAPTSPAATEQAVPGPAGHPATGHPATGPAATGPAATGPAATGRGAAGRVARTSTEEAIAAVEAMAGEQAGAHEQRPRRRAGGHHQDTREDAQEQPPAWREPPAQGRRARHEPPRGHHEQSDLEQPGRERTAAEELPGNRVAGNRVAGERAHAARAPQDRAPQDRAPQDRAVEERPHAEPAAAERPREKPRSAEASTAQAPARAEQEPARFDTKDTNVRDAARRLMDALTGRSDQEGPDETAAGDGVPEPRVPTGERPRSRAAAPSRHQVGSEVPTPPSALSTPSFPTAQPDSGTPGAPTFSESYRGEPEPGPELDDPALELDDPALEFDDPTAELDDPALELDGPALERDGAGLRIARGATEFPTAPKTFDDQGARSSRERAGSSAEPEHSDDAWLWQRSFHLPEDSSSRVSPEGAAAPTMPPLSNSSSRAAGSPGAGDPSLDDPSLDDPSFGDSGFGDPGLGDPGLPAPGIAGSGVTEFEYAELDDPGSDFAGAQYGGEGRPGPGRYDSGLSERDPAQYEPAQYEPAQHEPAKRDPARYDPARYDAARRDVPGHDVPSYDTSEHGPSRYDEPRYDEPRYDEPGYGVPRYELSDHGLPQPGRRSSRVDSEDPSWRDEEPGDVDLDRLDGEHLSDEEPGSYAEPGIRGGAVHGDSTYDGAGYDDEARARSGRTLAEIRESLRLLQERSGTATAAREAAAQPAAQFADPDLPLGGSPLGQSLLGDPGSGQAGNRRPSSGQRADDQGSDDQRASGQRAGGPTASDHSSSGQSTSVQASGGQSAGGQPTSGGRRRRRADPEDPLDDPSTESASDLLDRYRRWEPESASEDRVGAPAPEQVAPEQPAAEGPPAEPAEDAGLADLLAEALVAYESGRREPGEDDHDHLQNRREPQNDRGAQPRRQPQSRGEPQTRRGSQTHGQSEPRTAASSGRRHVEADAADAGVPVTRHLQESTSDGSGPGPSRRRRAAADHAPSYQSWTPPVEDNGPRRNFGP